MLKNIPKSNVTKRKFQVYKLWNVDLSTDGNYTITETSNPDSLYRSVNAKYYSKTDGDVTKTFGVFKNPALIESERIIPDTIKLLELPLEVIGERIKPSSIRLEGDGSVITDDGWGRLQNPEPTYYISGSDIQDETLIVTQNVTDVELTLLELDLEDSYLKIMYGGSTYEYTIVSIDYDNGLLLLTEEIDIPNSGIEGVTYGNVFYSDGLLVLDATIDLTTYTLKYRSTQTIYETEVLISVDAGEFNYSQNPTAVEVTLSGSYDFETTAITNVSPAKTVKIKEVLDIEQKQWFSGSLGSVSGSWDDYFTSASVDPTGSYLTTYITTIGLYDDEGDMIAVAKLPQPIKNLPDYNVNFIVRFDT